jgi:hypothetical protein
MGITNKLSEVPESLAGKPYPTCMRFVDEDRWRAGLRVVVG